MGYLRRVLGVTLRGKDHKSEIREVQDVKPLIRIDPSYATSPMCPEFSRKEWRTKSFKPQSTPTGKRPKARPRTRWSDYISDLSWSRLGVEPAELSEIAVDREVFRVLLGPLPPQLSPKVKRARKWVNEWVCTPAYLDLAIYEIVFSLFAKSEYRIQIMKHIWTETCVIAKMR